MSEADMMDFVGESLPAEVPDFSEPLPPAVAIVEPAASESASEPPASELPAGPCCGRCRHYRAHERKRSVDYDGDCLRYPPEPIVSRQNVVFWFPQVEKSERCGEYTPAAD